MAEEIKVDDDVSVVTENGTEVKVLEAKEGIMSKIGKHKKVIIGAAVAGAAIIGVKLLKHFRPGSDDETDDSGFDDDDDFESDDTAADTDDAE